MYFAKIFLHHYMLPKIFLGQGSFVLLSSLALWEICTKESKRKKPEKGKR